MPWTRRTVDRGRRGHDGSRGGRGSDSAQLEAARGTRRPAGDARRVAAASRAAAAPGKIPVEGTRPPPRVLDASGTMSTRSAVGPRAGRQTSTLPYEEQLVGLAEVRNET